MQTEQQSRALQALEYVLSKGSLSVEKHEKANTTYTFVECEDNITYALISDTASSFYAISIMTDNYNDVISIRKLFEEDTDKSRLVWDLLEAGGIRRSAIELLSKNKIPNNSHLTEEDWEIIRKA
jgi:hypothetical protein